MGREEIIWRDGSDRFDRSVRLSSPEAGPAAVERIRALAIEHFPALKGYQVEIAPTAAGAASGKIRLRDFVISLDVRAGQDRGYAPDGAVRACHTLSFEAEVRIPSLDRAEKTVEHVVVVSAVAGAVGGVALLVFVIKVLLEWLGAVYVPHAMFLVALGGGFFGGAVLGGFVGGLVSRRMASRKARDAAAVAAAGDWDAFVDKINRFLAGLENGHAGR